MNIKRTLTVGVVGMALLANAADASITGVTARQRYPWNGKVDIVVTFSGKSNDVAATTCVFVATNSAALATLPVVTISPSEGCSGYGTTWTRRFVWDASADVGAVKIDDVALTVGVVPSLGGVQLWEGGPYWAECNVGATKPEEYGYYFWWGDTVGYKRNANNNGWVSVKDGATFKFSESNCPTYGKDNSQLQSFGYIDSTGNLVAAHDAATAHLGAPWRMPSDAEFSALLSNCDTILTTKNGVNGGLITGRGAYASKSIFLPAAGCGGGSGLYGTDSDGRYLSSTPYLGSSYNAWRLYFDSGHFYRYFDYGRYSGQSVRPLREFATAGVSANAGLTTHLSLDCQTGTRTACETEKIRFSPAWESDAEGAVATVSVNGVAVTNATDEGVLEWTPAQSGTYTFTHTVSTNGVQVGDTLSVTFLAKVIKPDGGPYMETVDGIEWTYMVSGGKATIGTGSSSAAISTSSAGSVTVPSTLGGCPVTKIGSYAFSRSSGLISVTIPEGVTSIGDSSFRDCKGLSSLRIPEGVTNIGNCAFINCSGLKSVTTPSSMTIIGDCAFSDCKGLTSIAIPSSVTCIGNYAFFGCSSMTSMTFGGDAPLHWSPNAFDYCADGLTLYVSKDSTGWGVDIPGTWQYINIAYYTEYNVEGAGEVKIHDDWVEKYASGKSEAEVTELLAQTAANGKYKNWECYVLGLDPTNAESKITVSAPQSQDSGSISVVLNVNVPAGCGYTVSNEVTVVGGSGVRDVDAGPNGFTIDLTGDDDPSGLYSVKVKIVPDGSSTSASEIDVEQTVGVRKSTSALTKTAIAVPWGELAGGAISVSNLVKTANLTVGDRLSVYDRAGRRYDTWELGADRTWQPLATYTIDAQGRVSTTSAGKPEATTVTRGSAVWLERQDVSKPFYLYGEYVADAITTSVEAGTADAPNWSLLASPAQTAFDLTTIPLSGGSSAGAKDGDEIVVSTETGPRTYTLADGQWGFDENTTVEKTGPDGSTIRIVKKVRNVTDVTLPAGTGFWYVSHGGNPSITW